MYLTCIHLFSLKVNSVPFLQRWTVTTILLQEIRGTQVFPMKWLTTTAIFQSGSPPRRVYVSAVSVWSVGQTNWKPPAAEWSSPAGNVTNARWRFVEETGTALRSTTLLCLNFHMSTCCHWAEFFSRVIKERQICLIMLTNFSEYMVTFTFFKSSGKGV